MDLRRPTPDDARPVRGHVDGQWYGGELEAYRQESDGAWLGWVRWSEGVGKTRIGWFGETEIDPLS